jgi:hypothetical protein
VEYTKQMTDQIPDPSSADRRSRRTWLLGAVAVVAVVAAGLGGYFGFRAVSHGGAASAGVLPPARAGAAMAYDAANNTMVMFGGRGTGGTVLGDTWTWDGSNWTQRHPATAPSGRSGALMAYDPQSHDVLLFGGQTAVNAAIGSTGAASAPLPPSGLTGETWLWDGVNWRQATGAQPPLGSPYARMATDPATRSVVLVTGSAFVVRPESVCPLRVPPDGSLPPTTGCSGGPPVASAAKTWVWRGNTWEDAKAAPPTASASPLPPAAAIALVPDPETGRLAFLSGPSVAVSCSATLPKASPGIPGIPAVPPSTPCKVIAQPPASIDVSEWTGSSWSAPTSSVGGPVFAVGAGSGGVITADPASHSVVYLSPDESTWVWTSQWTQLTPPTHPPAQLFGATAIYDEALGRVLMFGGEVATPTGLDLSNQLWSWDGSTWSLVSGGTLPEPTPSGGVVPPVLPQSPVPTGVPGRCGFSPGAHPGVGPALPICPLPTLPA